MEIILAIVVASAVIFFGALISMGNERQRRAIDNLHEQISRWAIQDLTIKRETLARDVCVEDPMLWLNELIEKVSGHKVNLQIIEKSDDPQAILCGDQESDIKILYCFNSPKEIERFRKVRKSKLNLIYTHVFSQIPSKYNIYEATILNAGLLFDKEISIAWKALTGHLPSNAQKLWILVFDNSH
ncbi:MAG: hypothetical protein KF758_16945 [Anaerolineales bacterium]|nr:hypothetical protein [Anaerolineales bacterium]